MGRFHGTGLISLTGASLLLATQAVAGVSPPTPLEAAPERPADPALEKQINDNELYCLTLAVYFEGGSTGESREGQRYIARVVRLRAEANRRIWGGSEICDVVFYHRRGVCQFSFACLRLARRTPIEGPAWRLSQEIARAELEGRSPVHALFIRYYMNPELTSDRNACRFRREFVPVLVAGRHHFFREPLPRERKAVANGDYAECERLAKPGTKKKKTRMAKPIPKPRPQERLATNP